MQNFCHLSSAICHLLTAYCLLFAALFLPNIVSAENPKEQYKKLQKDIDTHKKKIEETKRREHSILEELERTNRDLSSMETELRKYRKRLRVTEGEINRVETEINANKAKLDKQREWIRRKLRILQRYGYSGDIILLVLTSEDMAQMMRRWKYLEALTLFERGVMEDYKENIRGLNEKENHLKSLRAEIKKNVEKIMAKEASLAEKKKEKETLLASVRGEKSSYEKMLRELKEASKRLLEIIRKSEETDAYAAKGFHGLKGRLLWPVDGKIAIPYGAQKDTQFNTPVFRNGIYIKADGDSLAKAVHGGKVVFAEWFKGYGQLLIINHGEGYHTLYANLSEIFYKNGDIIKEQQVIGRVGESGMLNAPGLYFEIRYKGKPLDPLQWLKRR